jgi:16S rRNA (adenine1518-N6/adenine1519-N6)-dimethyltransferase
MTITELRRVIEQIGLRPSKALGQNFLIDANIVEIILREARVRADETVIEIGPGLGALTGPLAGQAGRLVVVEKDARLAAYVRRAFPEIELIEGDAVEVELPPCDKVVGNLPYNISTPVLQRFVESEPKPRAIIVTLQREVAHRLAAKPRQKDYGALTLFTQLYYHGTIAHIVSPRCFFPEPKVESAVVVLERRDPRVKLEAGARFHELVRRGFAQRRKMLKKLLNELPGVEPALVEGGAAPTARAEELSLEQWIGLANALRR